MILDENWSRGSSRKVDSSHSQNLYKTPTKQLQGKKKSKSKLFSQAGYKLDTPPNLFVCCENNHTLTSLFKAHRKAWERSKATTPMWVSSGQHHFPWLEQAKEPRRLWAHRQPSSWSPSLTTCCSSQKSLSQLPQGFGIITPPKRYEQEGNNCLRLLRKSGKLVLLAAIWIGVVF